MEYEIDGQTISVGDVMTDKPVWRTILNGEDITSSVKGLACINEAMGIGFLYGASKTGGAYNQGHLYNRGGAVIVPTIWNEGTAYIAALQQVRPLQGSTPLFEFPRGQSNLGEAASDTARRELEEETGLSDDNILVVSYLGSGNPDNAIVLGQNVHFYAVAISGDCVDWDLMKIKDESFRPDSSSRLSEQIKGAQLIEAAHFYSPSMMTMAAMGFWHSHNG